MAMTYIYIYTCMYICLCIYTGADLECFERGNTKNFCKGMKHGNLTQDCYLH